MNSLTLRSLAALALSLSLGAGCNRSSSQAPPQPRPATVTASPGERVAVSVDAEGYHPATINAPAGAPLTLVFTRTTDEGCGQQLVFPNLNIRRDLPLNRPVEVAITTPAAGNVGFTCGMNMYQGSIVVR